MKSRILDNYDDSNMRLSVTFLHVTTTTKVKNFLLQESQNLTG